MLQLSLGPGHGQGQGGHQSPIDEGLGCIQQSQLIYRDAIRSVQEQLLHVSRCLVAARHEEQARLVPVTKKSKPSGPSFSTPPPNQNSNNNNNGHDVMSMSSVPTPLEKKRGILSNPQDDIWSSVPELSKARQMLDEARRVIRLSKKVAAHHQNYQPASLQTSSTSSAGSCDGVEKMISVATIGMYKHPLIIPSISSTNVTASKFSNPTTSSHPFNSSAHYARSNKMSEYISAIILYNYALTYHLHAIQTNDLAVLAKSANLYDMCVQVLHAELDDILKDYTTYNNGLQENCSDANGEALGTVTGSIQDPTLSNLQQVARTALGAALTNAGLIYHAFNEHNDATAVFNVLVKLCDVESGRRRRRENHRQDQEQPVGTAQTDTNVPSSEAISATTHEDSRISTVQTDDGPWDHFFCAAFALRAGTIAPCA